MTLGRSKSLLPAILYGHSPKESKETQTEIDVELFISFLSPSFQVSTEFVHMKHRTLQQNKRLPVFSKGF